MIKMITEFKNGLRLAETIDLIRCLGVFGGNSEVIVNEFQWRCINAKKLYDMYADDNDHDINLTFGEWLDKKIKQESTTCV